MSFLQRERNSNLNDKGKLVYQLWLDLESLDKVSTSLFNSGIMNEKRGTRYTHTTLTNVAWDWVLDNMSEALQMLRERDRNVTDEYWEQLMVNKAHSRFVTKMHSRVLFYDWLKEHDLYDKYKDYRSVSAGLNKKKVSETMSD